MIPLGDVTRRPVHFPIATLAIISLNFLVFLLELISGDAFITRWSVIPAHIAIRQDWITLLTAMFMHAGWIHILGNMLFLWVFGPEIEDAMGAGRYTAFYLLGGLVAAAAQILIDPSSTVPNLGASGAIAAVMGAFLVTYPQDRIKTVLFLGWFVRVTFIPAVLLVGFWFLAQLFNEVGALSAVDNGGVAYMAHIGGFIFGAVAAHWFETRQRLNQTRWDGA